MKSFLSIIVPTRNRCHIFPDTLDSIFMQVNKNIEVILSNNCSSDETESVASKYFRYPNFHYIEHKSVLTPAKHWNKVLNDYVKTKYVMFLPDDDKLSDPLFVDYALAILNDNHNTKLVFGDYQRFGSDDLVIQPKIPQSGSFHELFLKLKSNAYGVDGFGIPQLTAIFNTQLALKCCGFKYNCTSPDFLFWLSYLSHNSNMKYYHMNTIVSKYFVHQHSLSNTINLHSIFSDTFSVLQEVFNIPYISISRRSGIIVATQICFKIISLFFYMLKRSLKRFYDVKIVPSKSNLFATLSYRK